MTIWDLYPSRRSPKASAGSCRWSHALKPEPDHAIRLKRLHYRAHHRGTREADLMIGGYFDRDHVGWNAAELDWFEALLEEQDVDIMGWAIGSLPCPAAWDGAQMQAMRDVNYVTIPN